MCLYVVFGLKCKQRLFPYTSFILMETHTQFSLRYDVSLYCTMNLVCIRRPLTWKTRVLSEVSPFEVLGGRRGTGTGFSPSTSVCPCQFYSNSVTH